MKFLLFIVVSISINFTYAGLPEDFEQIKNLGRDLEPTGAICEEVARLRFSEKYPQPKYTVVTGIQYSDKFGNTIGELDLVVFDNQTQVANVIAEVKCWKSPKSGLKKAKEQRKRFLDHVNSSKALSFEWMFDRKKKLTKTQFNKTKTFYFIGQSGVVNHGFDFELPYSLDELMDLRNDILNCQTLGACSRPSH